jgi:hypothetical protein
MAGGHTAGHTRRPLCPSSKKRPALTFTTRAIAERSAWDHKGQVIEVAAGYDISSDSYLFHVYLLAANEEKAKLSLPGFAAKSIDSAYNQGFELGKVYIEKMTTPANFLTQVK